MGGDSEAKDRCEGCKEQGSVEEGDGGWERRARVEGWEGKMERCVGNVSVMRTNSLSLKE